MKKRMSEETSNRRATEAALRRECAATTVDQLQESPLVPRKTLSAEVVIDDFTSCANKFPASTLTPLNSNGSPSPSPKIQSPDIVSDPPGSEIMEAGPSLKRLTSQSSLPPGSLPGTPPGSPPGTPPPLNVDSDVSM